MVDLMQVPDPDTVVAGSGGAIGLSALLNSFWQRWKLGEKFKAIEERIDAVRKEAKERLDGHDEEIEQHAVYDARTYLPREEFSSIVARLEDKLDSKFDSLNSNIITAIRDGNGK